MRITKDDVMNHLRESFDVSRGGGSDGYGDGAWGHAETAENTYFTAPGLDAVIRDDMGDPVEVDTTLSEAGVTWRFQQTTARACDADSDNRFSKITEFTLPDGETFFVGASFTSDSWDAGSNYYATSGSIAEAHRREKIVHYFD